MVAVSVPLLQQVRVMESVIINKVNKGSLDFIVRVIGFVRTKLRHFSSIIPAG